MGRMKSAFKIAGEVLVAKAEQDAQVKQLTQEILNKSYGVEYDQAEKIARVLISRAEPIVWK
jgi:hypothetical protein